MSDNFPLKLVASRPAPAPANGERSTDRYRVILVKRAGRIPEITAIERRSGQIILAWRGRIAERILDMDALGLRSRGDHGFDCDKPLLQRLAIAGAAAERQVAEDVRSASTTRGASVSREESMLAGGSTIRWSSLHGAVLAVLEAFPKQHLAEEDVVCLIQLRLPCIPRRQVRAALADLAQWNQVQQITVPTGAVHYDLDTRPHLHVFDARTQQLRDAPPSGVLQVRDA